MHFDIKKIFCDPHKGYNFRKTVPLIVHAVSKIVPGVNSEFRRNLSKKKNNIFKYSFIYSFKYL